MCPNAECGATCLECEKKKRGARMNTIVIFLTVLAILAVLFGWLCTVAWCIFNHYVILGFMVFAVPVAALVTVAFKVAGYIDSEDSEVVANDS